MTPSYNNSIVIITPAAFEQTAVAMASAMGFEASFVQVASATGRAPFTHKYMHTWGQDVFKSQISGEAPVTIEGYTDAEIKALLAQLVVDIQAGGHAWQHVQSALSKAGLKPEARGEG